MAFAHVMLGPTEISIGSTDQPPASPNPIPLVEADAVGGQQFHDGRRPGRRHAKGYRRQAGPQGMSACLVRGVKTLSISTT